MAFVACHADDDAQPSNNGGNNGNGNNSSSVIGNWKVTYYWDKDKDETNDFSGYTFDFQSDGTLVGKIGGTTYQGTWSENNSSNKLILTITGTKALDDMTDDWLIQEKTSSSIKLKDDNTEHLEELYFERL